MSVFCVQYSEQCLSDYTSSTCLGLTLAPKPLVGLLCIICAYLLVLLFATLDFYDDAF